MVPSPLSARTKFPPAILKSVAEKLGNVAATSFQVPLFSVNTLALTGAVWVMVPVVPRLVLPVVAKPAVLTVPIDQLAALLVRLTEPVLPATVVMLLYVLPSV